MKTKYRANSLCRSIYIRKNNIFNSFVTWWKQQWKSNFLGFIVPFRTTRECNLETVHSPPFIKPRFRETFYARVNDIYNNLYFTLIELNDPLLS